MKTVTTTLGDEEHKTMVRLAKENNLTIPEYIRLAIRIQMDSHLEQQDEAGEEDDTR